MKEEKNRVILRTIIFLLNIILEKVWAHLATFYWRACMYQAMKASGRVYLC